VQFFDAVLVGGAVVLVVLVLVPNHVALSTGTTSMVANHQIRNDVLPSLAAIGGQLNHSVLRLMI
jgi:hypothetical protein